MNLGREASVWPVLGLLQVVVLVLVLVLAGAARWVGQGPCWPLAPATHGPSPEQVPVRYKTAPASSFQQRLQHRPAVGLGTLGPLPALAGAGKGKGAWILS